MERNKMAKIECNDQIIQVKLLNVEKNSLFIGDIFKQISLKGVNIDMISQVMLEEEMRIDFTCQYEDQKNLNKALEVIKQKHERIMIYQNRNVAKIVVEDKTMENEVGVAAQLFEIFGKLQIPLMQVTTSKTSISYVIPKEMTELAIDEIKKNYNLGGYNMKPIFEGSAVALVLPMFDDGRIDYESFKRQVQRMIDGGVQALLVNGTTGETATITIEEEFELTKITMDLAKGTGVKVIAGAGSNDTMTALKKAQFAKDIGADAILVVTPYYNKTSQRGLIEHYTYIADRVDIPMIIYNVPGRTGMSITVDTVVELAKHRNIKAIKDATDNIAYAMDILSQTKDLDFDMYSGCDDNILPFMAAGGKGVISVLANVYPRETEMFAQAVLNGNIKLGQKMAYDFNDLSKYLFIDVNPIMPKVALKKLEVCGEMVRRPLIPTTEANKKLLYDAMNVFEKKGY